jgi:hypothetical protein
VAKVEGAGDVDPMTNRAGAFLNQSRADAKLKVSTRQICEEV